MINKMYFDPSKSITGYSRDEYIKLMSIYTRNKRPKTDAIDYIILAQRAIVSAQRHQNIDFNKNNINPEISHHLPHFNHYIPGNNYDNEELEVFYKHYNSKDLDEVHMKLESMYPLDPSFVKTVKYLKTLSKNHEIIKYLCYMFNEKDKESLFKNRYIIRNELDSDINLKLLETSPELFLTNNYVEKIDDEIDLYKLSNNLYTPTELFNLSVIYNINTKNNEEIIKNLYLIHHMPIFYIPEKSSCNGIAYGIKDKNAGICLSIDKLYKSIKDNEDFVYKDIHFNFIAINRLLYLLKKDNNTKFYNLIEDIIMSDKFNKYMIDINFLYNLPEIKMPGTKKTYFKLVLEAINYLKIMTEDKEDITPDLKEFMKLITQMPTIVSEVLLRLPCEKSDLTIGELYNEIIKGNIDKNTKTILIKTSKKYLKILNG